MTQFEISLEKQALMPNPPISNFLFDPSPLPAKKSTKLGAGGFMSAVEEIEGGVSKGTFGKWAGCELCHSVNLVVCRSRPGLEVWMRRGS